MANLGYVPGVAVATFFIWLWWQSTVRARELRSLAESCGFHYLGDALPRSLPLAGSPLASMTGVWNVIDGEPRGKRIVAFDCRFGVGRGSWRRTVIAIRTEIASITTSFFDPSLRIEQVNDWIFIYRPKDFARFPQLIPIPELRAYLQTI
jgi:hypothetical protein